MLVVTTTLAVGCRVTPPPVAVASSYGIARASTEKEARQVATWIRELVPEIRAMVPGTVQLQPDVWVQDKIRIRAFHDVPDDVSGITIGKARILIRSDDEHQRETLCHELAHHLLDASWSTLPTVVEEGLCEKVSEELAAIDATEFRSRRLATALQYFGGIQGTVAVRYRATDGTEVHASIPFESEPDLGGGADPKEALALEGGYTQITSGKIGGFHYAFGYWLVDRIVRRGDYRVLHELARSAGAQGLSLVPVDWVIEAAELGDDTRKWRDELLRRIGPAEVNYIAREISDALADRIADYLDEYLPQQTRIGRSLDGLAVELVIEGGAYVSAAELVDFRARLLDRLESRGRVEPETPTEPVMKTEPAS